MLLLLWPYFVYGFFWVFAWTFSVAIFKANKLSFLEKGLFISLAVALGVFGPSFVLHGIINLLPHIPKHVREWGVLLAMVL